MNAKCSDTRNRESVELINNELLLYFKCSLSCSKFHSFFLSEKINCWKKLQVALGID